jgi:hypothetical protein
MNSRAEQSLLPGRSTRPLEEDDIRQVANTFIGLLHDVVARYDEHGCTRFELLNDGDGTYGCIFFGADIYPGTAMAFANSALGMKAAVAHELCHLHRWEDRTELPIGEFRHLDEALTSLEAALRYGPKLGDLAVSELVRDAMQRLALLRAELQDEEPPALS